MGYWFSFDYINIRIMLFIIYIVKIKYNNESTNQTRGL